MITPHLTLSSIASIDRVAPADPSAAPDRGFVPN
jgi:hypothetical protein